MVTFLWYSDFIYNAYTCIMQTIYSYKRILHKYLKYIFKNKTHCQILFYMAK